MKRINIFAVLTMSASALFAQTQYDAARITGTELNGTARFVGMGGAMGALGADHRNKSGRYSVVQKS